MSDATTTGAVTSLASRSCEPCKEGTPALDAAAIEPLIAQLDDWEVVDGHHLSKIYKFSNFQDALDFVNRVGAIAEAEGHHPDIFLAWGRVRLEIFTHAIRGLSESDFVLAAKADEAR